MRCKAVGAIPIGIETACPFRIVVFKRLVDTSVMNRGLSRSLVKKKSQEEYVACTF
jgi:hypothetical protein